MQCLSFRTSASSPHPPSSQVSSTDGTPSSNTHVSPPVNLAGEYTFAVQTNSYNEMWSRIHLSGEHFEQDDQIHVENVLQPNRESIDEALRHAKPSTLTRLVSAYFEHSEKACNLCLLLNQSVGRARELYGPLHQLLDVFPHDLNSISQSQCDWAYDIFFQFVSVGNPFPSPDSNDSNEMRQCFSKLKKQLDRQLRKSHSRLRLLRRTVIGSAVCLIGTAVVAAISAALISTHALAAICATPLCAASHVPRNFKKKELAHIAQLNAAAKGTYVLNGDLDTIDCLVARLHTAVEGDRDLIQLSLERGRDKYPTHEVVKLLRKTHVNFMNQLSGLEEHLVLWFNMLNRARILLLQEIHPHQSRDS